MEEAVRSEEEEERRRGAEAVSVCLWVYRCTGRSVRKGKEPKERKGGNGCQLLFLLFSPACTVLLCIYACLVPRHTARSSAQRALSLSPLSGTASILGLAGLI